MNVSSLEVGKKYSCEMMGEEEFIEILWRTEEKILYKDKYGKEFLVFKEEWDDDEFENYEEKKAKRTVSFALVKQVDHYVLLAYNPDDADYESTMYGEVLQAPAITLDGTILEFEG